MMCVVCWAIVQSRCCCGRRCCRIVSPFHVSESVYCFVVYVFESGFRDLEFATLSCVSWFGVLVLFVAVQIFVDFVVVSVGF